MLDDRLALSVTTNDGAVTRWGGDEPDAERIPQDLDFGSAIPGGYKDLSCSLLRRFSGPERLFNRVRAYGPGNRTAWDGRLVQFPRDDLLVNPGAVGHAAHLRDDPSFREIYVDQDLAHWGGSSVQFRLNGTGTYTVEDPSVVPDATTGQPSLASSFKGPWLDASRPRAAAWYGSQGIPIGKLFYAWKKTSTVDHTSGNWIWDAHLSTDDVATSTNATGNLRAAGPGTGTVTATPPNKVFGVLQHFYGGGAGGAENTEYTIYWTCLGVYGTHGLTKQGTASATEAQGFYGHDLIRDIVSRGAPLLSTGGIESNIGFIVEQATFLDPVTPEEALMAINAYFLWEWGVFDDLEFFWRPPDPTRLVWGVRPSEGAHISEEGPTAEAQYNGVIVRYQDPNGQAKIAGPPAGYWQGGIARCDTTDVNLVDTSPENAVNAAGIPRRWGVLEIGFPTTSIGATELGVVWLAEHSLPQRRGTITVTGAANHPTEGYVPPWRIRAGDGVKDASVEGDTPRRIIEARYSRRDDTATLTVGNNTAFKLDAILERVGVSLAGVI